MESIPPGEVPDQLQVHAFTVDDEQSNDNCSVTVPFTLNSNGMVFIHFNNSICGPGRMHYRRYKTIITAMNDLGGTDSMEEILFSKLYNIHIRL